MRRRAVLVSALLTLLVLSAGSLPGESPRTRDGSGIPAHPRELRFPEVPFAVPEAASFRHTLPNGVPVYIVEDHTLPLVDIAVVLKAGEYLDPPGETGLAALTAAMLRRAGAGDLGPEAFDDRADFLAAHLAASAGSMRAGASLNAPSWVLPEALDLLFDLLRRPRFDPASLALAKSNLLAGMDGRNDDPLAVLDREWRYLLHGEEHFSVRQVTPESLTRITPEALDAFHRRYWHPGGGMVLAVSGDVEAERLLAELARRFEGWEAGEAPPWPPPAPQHVPRPGLYHLERDLPQAKVAVGHLGAVRRGWDDPDFYTLTVLGEILGGGAVSRIAARLRGTEGLAYRAGASFGVGDLWPGDFRIHVETANENVALAVKLALGEVELLRRQPVAAEELALAKRSITRVFPQLFDSAAEVAGYFAEDEFLGRPHGFWEHYRERIEAVTAEDVRRAAEAYLHPDEVVIVTVGKWRLIEAGDAARRARAGDFYDGLVLFLEERDPRTLKPRR